MTRSSTIRKWVSLITFTVCVASATIAQRPNIIYIMADDMGYGDLSCYGQKNFATPHLDKLASQGIKFTNAYAAAPFCTPTRTAFITGRYAARTPVGLIEPLTSTKKDSSFGLTPQYPSIATLMKEAGYETALIGKWHLGFLPQHSPLKNGFDYFFGIRTGSADYHSFKGDAGVHDLYENDSPVYPKGYLTEIFSQKAAAFVKQPHDRPFFLYLSYNAPHWPWQGPGDKPYADTVNFRAGGSPETYKAMLQSLDEGIGSILNTLDMLDLSQQTLVIFTNDNGGERYSDNGGLAKAKGSLWEGGIKVPAIVKWPGTISQGATTAQVANTPDWTATILSIAGAKPRKEFPLDGINLLPVLLANKINIKRTIYWRTFQRRNQKAIRDGDWKYLVDEKEEYLFNLKEDEEEKHNLKNIHPLIFKTLKAKYARWEKTVLAPIPL